MGINVSRCSKDSDNPEDLAQLVREIEACRETPSRIQEPQRNDNATKLIQPERAILLSPSPLSSSSGLSIKSIQKPRLEHTPQLYRAQQDTCARDSIHEANDHWIEHTQRRRHDITKPRKIRTTPKPPWKPNILFSPPLCDVTKGQLLEPLRHTKIGTLPPSVCSLNRGVQMGGSSVAFARHAVSRRSGGTLGSSASLASPYALWLQTGEAHLRRCSAAQQVRARKPDLLDSISIDRCSKVLMGGSTMDVKRGRLKIGRLNGRLSKSNNRFVSGATVPNTVLGRIPFSEPDVDNNLTETTLSQSIDEDFHLNQPNRNATVMPTTAHDDAFPLRYVFYVQDDPVTIRAFACGGRITTLARDTQCRVYFHAQHSRSFPFSTRTGVENGDQILVGNRSVEPTLYYLGKRVRPVTVAARGMVELHQFLDKLDQIHPEFQAGSHLASDLVLAPIVDREYGCG